jgi:hypothetical protein
LSNWTFKIKYFYTIISRIQWRCGSWRGAGGVGSMVGSGGTRLRGIVNSLGRKLP